jgi:hypothetical protein
MTISGIGAITGTSTSTFASSVNTPAVQMMQASASTASALFGSLTSSPSSAVTDVSSFTPTAAAYSLLLNPALLMQLQQWDGSATPGSQRTPVETTDPNSVVTATGAAAAPPQFSFNPFDEASWDQPVSGNNVDASA